MPYEPRVRISSAALLPLILLVPSVTEAQPKPKVEFTKGPVGKAVPACGARILPLVEGNQWTYVFIQAPTGPRDDLAKLTPSQPQQVVITVKKVETNGPDTVATLEEKTTTDLSKDPKKHILDERTITSTITCNQKKFEISPESFFFAGEPGGFFGLTFDKFERSKDTSLKLVNGTIGENEWREDIVAHFTRTSVPGSGATLGGGTLELERRFKPGQPENVNTKAGLYYAEHVVLVTTGRVTLEQRQPDTKPMDLPDKWNNQLWLVPNAGVVQVLNAYSHMYSLADAQLK